MKIEKISDNQIRCTLNRTDLAERELKLSELAYGSEKARDLFREMMQQASYEFGFEAEDMPIMIEAIPVSSDCIVLMITKVEDPEELDTRFSKFAPAIDDADELQGENADDFEIDSLFSKIQELRESILSNADVLDKIENIEHTPPGESEKSVSDTKTAATTDNKEITSNSVRVFSFNSLEQAENGCAHVSRILQADTALYKDTGNNSYLLAISRPQCDIDTLNKACHILSEYGTRLRAQYATEQYYKEHFTTIIKKNAVNILSNI